jgi:hypothetical protein
MADANNLSIMSQYVLPAAGGLAEDSAIQPGPGELQALVGSYRSERGVFTVELRDGTPWAESENTPSIQLSPVGPSRFRGTALGLIEVDFVFEVDADGAVTGGRTSFGFTVDRFVRDDS